MRTARSRYRCAASWTGSTTAPTACGSSTTRPGVVDYKTGATPGEGYESGVLFQLKFYALAVLLTHGRVPDELRLLYLADGTALTYRPDAEELTRFGRLLDAVWTAIRLAAPTGDFRPRPGPACRTCDHQARCPAWGGTPPPYPGWPGGGA